MLKMEISSREDKTELTYSLTFLTSWSLDQRCIDYRQPWQGK